jgi:alpha-N-acetylglucosaminidase
MILRPILTLIAATAIAVAAPEAAPSAADIVTQSRELTKRVVPSQADAFTYEVIPAEGELDVFELEAVDGKIHLRGNSPLSIGMALNWYLRYDVKVNYDWRAAGPLEVPATLPMPAEKIRRVCSAKDRFFMNYCTFGYTLPFTDAPGWQRLLDWMALNGINRPLMQAGQEAVWYRVWKSYGMDDLAIRSYFAGPGHLPWHRMANLDRWAGPLPASYMEGQMKLQVELVKRARALGMKPILSAFTGHVPQDLKAIKKDAKITQIKPGWAGMEAKYATWFLDPTDPLFAEIQKRFLTEQTALYGTDHAYAADPFNEIDPPSWEAEYLFAVSKSIYEGMTAADPDAIWYQMSWNFTFDQRWLAKPAKGGDTAFQAITKAVPTGKMIFLDYVCEEQDIYSQTNSFEGAPFVWNYLANFGGCTYQLAPLEKTSKALAEATKQPNWLGVGSTLEGIGVDAIGYDLTFEQPWHPDTKVDYRKWVADYAARRSGNNDPAVASAWDILMEKVLKNRMKPGWDHGSVITWRPEFNTESDTPAPKTALRDGKVKAAREPEMMAAYVEAIDTLFKASPESQKADGYRYDSVNWVRQALAYHSDNVREKLMAAYRAGDKEGVKLHGETMVSIIRDLDELVGTRHEFLFGTWVRDAKKWAKNKQEEAYYEKNSRQILTTWLQPGGGLMDYARREWNGLLATYYLPRWEEFTKRLIESSQRGKPFDPGAYHTWCNEFEGKWLEKTNQEFLTAPKGDSVETAKRIYAKYRSELTK